MSIIDHTDKGWEDLAEIRKAEIRELVGRHMDRLEELLGRYILPSRVQRVNTNLPELGVDILIETYHKFWQIGSRVYVDNEGWYWTDSQGYPIDDEVTAWADLPSHTSQPQEAAQ